MQVLPSLQGYDPHHQAVACPATHSSRCWMLWRNQSSVFPMTGYVCGVEEGVCRGAYHTQYVVCIGYVHIRTTICFVHVVHMSAYVVPAPPAPHNPPPHAPQWILYDASNNATYPCVANGDAYRANIAAQGGPEALEQWLALERLMAPLQQGASLFPAAAIRSDLGVVLTAARFGPQLAMTGLMAGTLTGPFSKVVDRVVTNPWLRKFLDLECFVLSGMLAKDTICAEMAFMFMERNSGRSSIDYPLGGSKAIVDALLRGIAKHGGRVELRAHVDQVLMQGIVFLGGV